MQKWPRAGREGYRVIVPSLRGYGTTRFISDKTPRNGQPSAMAKDIVNLMDALNIKQAVFAGYDWGRVRQISLQRSGRNG